MLASVPISSYQTMLAITNSRLLLAVFTALGLPLLLSQLGHTQQPTVGTIQRLTSGDRACYVELISDQGQRSTQLASFEICLQDLVGQRAQLTYDLGDILAVSCQGNLDCSETETVLLITQVSAMSEPRPGTRSAITRVQDLPNGNYRYWNGTPSGAVVSSDTLMANGGVTFTFRKQGNNITGIFGYVDGEAACVQGQVNGNTVSGISVQNLAGASVLSAGETFQPFGPSGYLQVRRGRRVSPNVVRYSSTLLNLNGLNRINAGAQVPPRVC
jgi:hypothetical protein